MRRQRPEGEKGIALIIVLLAITLMTAVVVQFNYDAHIDYSLAANEADETRAYYLAKSGVEMYKLILTADQKIGSNPQIKQFFEAQGLPPIELWRMIPQLDTAMLRSVSSPDMPEETKAELKERFGGIAFDTLGKTDGFLDFDGDIHAEVAAEECKINLNAIADERMEGPLDSSVGRALYALTLDEKYDPIFEGGDNALGERKLPREEVIANIIDWVDPNTQTILGAASEDVVYGGYEERYAAKNAKFETLAEVGMVRGVDDEFMAAFGNRFTVFGTAKVNVNCADQQTLSALLLSYGDAAIDAKTALDLSGRILEYRQLTSFAKPEDFVTFVESLGFPWRKLPAPNQAKSVVQDKISIESRNFTIRSTGYAGEARVTITAVVDNTPPASMRYLYWRVD